MKKSPEKDVYKFMKLGDILNKDKLTKVDVLALLQSFEEHPG